MAETMAASSVRGQLRQRGVVLSVFCLCAMPLYKCVRTRVGSRSKWGLMCHVIGPKPSGSWNVHACIRALRDGSVVFPRNPVAPCLCQGPSAARGAPHADAHRGLTYPSPPRPQGAVQTLRIPLLVVVLSRWRRRRRHGSLLLLRLLPFRRSAGRGPAPATGPGRRRRLQIRLR